MKKITALTLAAIAALSLTGCAKQFDPSLSLKEETAAIETWNDYSEAEKVQLCEDVRSPAWPSDMKYTLVLETLCERRGL